jgi:hypothetical protein
MGKKKSSKLSHKERRRRQLRGTEERGSLRLLLRFKKIH